MLDYMRYFIISDVHGNLPALEEILRDMNKYYSPSFLVSGTRKKDTLVNLGDLVGYMPYPNEVVKKVYKLARINLPGNHDDAVFRINDISHWVDEAQWAMSWTIKNLDNESKHILSKITWDMEEIVEENGLVFAHSTPFKPERMEYVNSELSAAEGFFNHDEFIGKFGFVGHSHIPQLYTIEKGKRAQLDLDEERVYCAVSRRRKVVSFDLRGDESALTVVPSVGQPRDECRLSGYCVYDLKDKRLDFVRVSCDYQSLQDKMKALNFPSKLVNGLAHGTMGNFL